MRDRRWLSLARRLSTYPGNGGVGYVIVDTDDNLVSAGGTDLSTTKGHTLYLWGTPPEINSKAFTRIVVSSSMPPLNIDEVTL